MARVISDPDPARADDPDRAAAPVRDAADAEPLRACAAVAARLADDDCGACARPDERERGSRVRALRPGSLPPGLPSGRRLPRSAISFRCPPR
ncbi:hypothetical protein [Tomitella fengzijianii]|uniref:hypothetical protein n=1 Tax=Tomitella fengzijianii TaxID=2597660 RepID=UPI00131C1D19|nr:hypothetical protein [Tomitella fengzijianii]